MRSFLDREKESGIRRPCVTASRSSFRPNARSKIGNGNNRERRIRSIFDSFAQFIFRSNNSPIGDEKIKYGRKNFRSPIELRRVLIADYFREIKGLISRQKSFPTFSLVYLVASISPSPVLFFYNCNNSLPTI